MPVQGHEHILISNIHRSHLYAATAIFACFYPKGPYLPEKVTDLTVSIDGRLGETWNGYDFLVTYLYEV